MSPCSTSQRSSSPCDRYAVMVGRQYAVRVRDAMITPPVERWTRLDGSADAGRSRPPETDGPSADSDRGGRSDGWTGETRSLDRTERYPVHHALFSSASSEQCKVIHTPLERGRRKDRRGYVLLLIRGPVSRSPADLSPLARMNISWAAPLTRRVRCRDGEEEVTLSSSADLVSDVARDAFRDLVDAHGFRIDGSALRVDAHPKGVAGDFCGALQKCAAAAAEASANGAIVDDDPFEGPVDVTRSAARCTHVVTVIRASPSEYYWGVSSSSTPAAASGGDRGVLSPSDDDPVSLGWRFNHNASKDVWVEPTDSVTGADLVTGSHIVPLRAPVSRAYYKLSEVFSEILTADTIDGLTNGWGMDLGASPGGWTQVLRTKVGLRGVVSVDPGTLAERVTTMKNVRHVRSDFSGADSIKALAETGTDGGRDVPYSCIVCDASIDSHDIICMIADTVEKVARFICLSEAKGSLMTLPSTLVVTLKLPHKTEASMSRNLGKVFRTVEPNLQRIALCAFSSSKGGSGGGASDNVGIQYRILHLMANSESERTLVALFYDDEL